jgi:hypothetical protein
MNQLQKRFLLFLICCIGSRLLITYIAKNINIVYLPILGYIALLPVIGFTYIYITDSRKTGAEVFGGNIWWNYLRPIHAIFYGLFAYYAINKNKDSWMYLLLDVSFGLIMFLLHHYLVGSFSKLGVL